MRVGDTVNGKFELVRFIGEGGMGSVWEAVHLTIDRKVAIKFLHAAATRSQSGFDKLKQEARAASAVGEGSVVQVLDVDVTTDGTAFMVMEYLDGESLEALLARCRPMPIDEAVSTVIRVLRALERVHAKGIVHRDLKPDNIFICGTGPAREFKLLDFGLSTRMQRPGESRSSSAGAPAGTPMYMSPELVRGDASVDRRTDIYSMGVVLYECVYGSSPFPGQTVGQVIERILGGPPEMDPRGSSVHVPEGLRSILRKALAKDPGSRHQSCADLARDLEGYLGSSQKRTAVLPEGMVAGIDGEASSQAARGRSRARWIAVTAVVALLAAAAALFAHMSGWWTAPTGHESSAAADDGGTGGIGGIGKGGEEAAGKGPAGAPQPDGVAGPVPEDGSPQAGVEAAEAPPGEKKKKPAEPGVEETAGSESKLKHTGHSTQMVTKFE